MKVRTEGLKSVVRGGVNGGLEKGLKSERVQLVVLLSIATI